MYSRYHDRPVRVPENYGGVAFSETPSVKETPHRLDVAKPTPLSTIEGKDLPLMPPPPKALHLPPMPTEPPPCENTESPSKETHDIPASKGGGFSPWQSSHLLFGKMKFDDLLLLALILLLSQNGSESDLLPCLALLLFCG